jgi:DNA modification methylase
MSEKVTIGDATLYLGDCREILPTLDPVDSVITDPPYGVGFKYESHDDRPEAYEIGYGKWLMQILTMCETVSAPGAPVFVWQSGTNIKNFSAWFERDWRLFCAAKNFVQMRPTAMQWSFDPIVVWWTEGGKPWSAGTASKDFHIANTAPVIGQKSNIERGHPCPRPLDQVEHIITQWVKPTGIVLDPFMGSGTAGVASVRNGRKFVGVEIEPKYFEIACRRIEDTQRQGVLLDHQPIAEQLSFDA